MTKLLEDVLARGRTLSDDDGTGAAPDQGWEQYQLGAFATDRDVAELFARHGA
ncbi:MAG TPA: hypothetical protein VGD36_06770 [Xanthobacteraceae bacterium]|jgi:hypothetical protein